MAGQETRVTKITKLRDQLRLDSESCLVQIHGPDLGKKYIIDTEDGLLSASCADMPLQTIAPKPSRSTEM